MSRASARYIAATLTAAAGSVGRLVDVLMLTVEVDGKPTRLEAVCVTARQQQSSFGANDFEGERWVACDVAGDFDGQGAAADHASLYEQVVGCSALDLLAGVGERDRRVLQG